MKKILYLTLLLLCISFSLFMGMQYFRFKTTMELQNSKLSAGSQTTQTDYGAIEYAVAGSGPPVLIIHGAGGGYDQGLLLSQMLLPDNCQVIAISRYGYLGTPLIENPTPDNQVKQYIALLDQLGYEAVHVVGVSDGGPSALKMSIQYPDRVKSLTMIAAKSQTPPEMTPAQALVFGHIFNNDFVFWSITEFAKEDLYVMLGVSKTVQAQLSDEEKRLARSFLNSMHPISKRKDGIMNANVQFKTLSEADYPLWKIKAPTLVVHAEDDTLQPFYYAKYTYSSIENAELLAFDQGGHMLFGNHDQIRSKIAERILASDTLQ